MKDESKFFERKKADQKKLLNFGFVKNNSDYIYETKILHSTFVLKIKISDNQIYTAVYDNDNEYVLHNIPGAEGEFVGAVREEYQKILNDVRDNCFIPDVFKSHEAKAIIKYVFEKYGDELEFLWDKLPDAAILRRKDNRKWYAVFMKINPEKLGLSGNSSVEIIDLKADPEKILEIVDNKRFFPGYHMNKKNWLTICFNRSVSLTQVIELIDNSYHLARK